jgi:transposase-like protein
MRLASPFAPRMSPSPRRSHEGKLLLAGAVEIKGKAPGRARLAVIESDAAKALHDFVATAIAKDSTVVSDGWSGYARLKNVKHDPKIVGPMAAHVVLPWVHRVFANAKRWALGVYHGLRRKHLQSYLDEFVFRFNRRRTPAAAFTRLLDLSLAHQPTTYQILISRS